MVTREARRFDSNDVVMMEEIIELWIGWMGKEGQVYGPTTLDFLLSTTDVTTG